MHKYGLTYDGASGTFFPNEDMDRIDLMLAAAERHFPEIHVASILENGHMINCYVENADRYRLYRGNTDPEIEFTDEFLSSDFSEEEERLAREEREKLRRVPPPPADVAAVNWMLQKLMNPKKAAK